MADRPVILITGASSGIGEALAIELARRRPTGRYVLTARRLDRLDRLADELRKTFPSVETLTIPVDLAEPDGPARLASEVVERVGGVDILVNNAGLGLPNQFAEAEPDQIARQLGVNLTAPLMLTRFLLPSLIERKGTIINIGSAITCVATSALGAYGATKAGIAYWNDALRRELIPMGVRVCLVEPGPIKTGFMEAVESRIPPGESYDQVIDNVMPWMTANVRDVARKIAGLADRPRRRLSMLKRVVWPFRALGTIATLCPPLGDLVVVRLTRRPLAAPRTAEKAL